MDHISDDITSCFSYVLCIMSRGVGRVLKVGRLWALQWVEPNIIRLSKACTMQLVVVQ